MNDNVYRSEEGKNMIRDEYRKILDGYTAFPFERLIVPAKPETHVLRFGSPSKQPLVMIHGSVSNSAAWFGCIPEFIADFCLYCADIPGEPGLSEPARCGFVSDEPFEWIDSLLGCLGIEKACFLTMSLGSWYALNYAVRKPEKVAALSVITAGGIVPARTGFIFKAMFYMMLGRAGQKMLNRAVYHKTAVPDTVLEFQALASRHFNPVAEPLPVFTDSQLSKIKSPLQFFGGDRDALIDSVKTAKRLRNLFPDADVHILGDTGHVILGCFPEAAEFLRKQVPSGDTGPDRTPAAV